MRRALPFSFAFIAACSSDPAVTPTDAAADAAVTPDVSVTPDVPVTPDAPVSTDVPVSTGCGTERPAISAVRGTEGLVIAADGTIYYSQSRAVGRIRPGMPAEARWASLPTSASTCLLYTSDAADE